MTIYIEKPIIIALRVEVLPEFHHNFADWQARLNFAIADFPGFVSLEILSPSSEQHGWLIVQRFVGDAECRLWHNSLAFNSLKKELGEMVVNHEIKEAFSAESNARDGVTEVIITHVVPDQEKAYREWCAKIHRTEATFPGFRGVYLQQPIKNKGIHWITLLQFDTMANLDNWLVSPERQALIEESSSCISFFETHRVISPYAGWFSSIAKLGEMPPVWKQTMLVLLVLFPIVMLELKYLSPLTAGLNMSLGTFIGNTLSVVLIAFPLLPIAIWFLSWWLSPVNSKNQAYFTVVGTLVVLGLYLVEIVAFWSFL